MDRTAPARRRATSVLTCCVLAATLAACGTNEQTRRKRPRAAYLRVDVVPRRAHIYVDERYQGEIARWSKQTLVLQPGLRRVQVRAPGYISQRFDITLVADRITVLRLRMEPTLPEHSSTSAPTSRRTP